MAKRDGEGGPGQKGTRSRREVLAGAAGALAVLGAETPVRATPAQAGTDGDVVLAAVNGAIGTTVINNDSYFGAGFKATGLGGGLWQSATTPRVRTQRRVRGRIR